MNNFSERRLVENELMFRSANRKVEQHVTAERTPYSGPDQTKLRFYCECSNLDCRSRIIMTADEYHAVSPGRKEFIVIPGHENDDIEKIVKTTKLYCVVEKYLDPAKITAEY
jgi:hypothetical protein